MLFLPCYSRLFWEAERELPRELFKDLAVMQAPETTPSSLSALVFSFFFLCNTNVQQGLGS